MELRADVQRIALEFPCYGWRRVTAELRRHGWTVNHKRIRRILREDNLLWVRKRKFVVTTDSNHGRKVYPNLACQMALTGIHQLWVADITYLRLETEFVYLAVVIEAYFAPNEVAPAGVSMRVKAHAKRIKETRPGMTHSGPLCIRTHAQNAKQPAISARAASKYQSREIIRRVAPVSSGTLVQISFQPRSRWEG